jgi:drug/metabolite transporter (DMT)-like permease
MNAVKFVGILVLVAGIILVAFGINSMNAPAEKMVEGATGRFTDKTMMYFISGVLMIFGGGIFASRKVR